MLTEHWDCLSWGADTSNLNVLSSAWFRHRTGAHGVGLRRWRTLSVRCSVPGVDGIGLCPVGHVSGNSLSAALVGYLFFEIIDDFGDVAIGVRDCLELWSRLFVGSVRRG